MIHVEGLDNRVAVVTGAARGIGREIVNAFVMNGARVAALDLEVDEYCGAAGYACDVSDANSVDAVFSTIEANQGPISVLVLNAGVFPIAELEQTTLELWTRTLDINLTGAYICARRALPGMREGGYGRVLSVASTAGKTGGVGSVSAYAASKGGLLAFTKAIATEYADSGVTSNALAPAFIETDMIRERGQFVEKLPVGRLGKPEEVAELAAWLCSSGAAFTTGSVFDMDGGLLMD